MIERTDEGRRLLLVEDDATLAGVVERAGAALNLRVERATDGWDAIEKLEENDYSVIVVDLDVPQSSGFGVVTYLRQEFGQQLDHVIVMTEGKKSLVEEHYPSASFRIIRRTDSPDRWTEMLGSVTPRE